MVAHPERGYESTFMCFARAIRVDRVAALKEKHLDLYYVFAIVAGVTVGVGVASALTLIGFAPSAYVAGVMCGISITSVFVAVDHYLCKEKQLKDTFS